MRAGVGEWRGAMTDNTTTLPWLVIREDDNGNRYRVGRFATRAEAQRTADSFDNGGHKQLYWVERLTPNPEPGQNGAGR